MRALADAAVDELIATLDLDGRVVEWSRGAELLSGHPAPDALGRSLGELLQAGDAIGLTNMVNKLNHGLDLGNNPIGKPTAFSIGVGVNPGAVNLDEEIKRFEWKVEAGAEYAITQPVFDTEQLRVFLDRIAHVRIPIVAGIWPLVSYRNAEFMHNEVPGVNVTADILERMRKASDKGKEEAREEGIVIARESLLEVRDVIQGVQVSAPFGNVKYALQVFEALEEFKPASN